MIKLIIIINNDKRCTVHVLKSNESVTFVRTLPVLLSCHNETVGEQILQHSYSFQTCR